MTPQEIDTIRKECKKIIVDLDMDNRKGGGYRKITGALNRRLERIISTNTLCMCLTGHRQSPAYQTLLAELHVMLTEVITTGDRSVFGEHIHNQDGVCN